MGRGGKVEERGRWWIYVQSGRTNCLEQDGEKEEGFSLEGKEGKERKRKRSERKGEGVRRCQSRIRCNWTAYGAALPSWWDGGRGST